MRYHVQDQRQIFKEAPSCLQSASKIPLGRLQDAYKTLPSRLQDALKSFANRHEASSRLQAAPKTPQDGSRTPKHASRQPPRGLQDGPRRCQGAFKTTSVIKKPVWSPSQPMATGVAYAEAVHLWKPLPISNNSEITHRRGSAALA